MHLCIRFLAEMKQITESLSFGQKFTPTCYLHMRHTHTGACIPFYSTVPLHAVRCLCPQSEWSRSLSLSSRAPLYHAPQTTGAAGPPSRLTWGFSHTTPSPNNTTTHHVHHITCSPVSTVRHDQINALSDNSSLHLDLLKQVVKIRHSSNNTGYEILHRIQLQPNSSSIN